MQRRTISRQKKPQVFRCDKIHFVQSCDKYMAKPLSEFLISPKDMFRENDSIDFEVGVSAKGVDVFYKEHYPSMELCQENGKYYVRGFYNKGEEPFIANYFTIYGEMIFSVRPDSLKNLILDRLDTIKNHFISI
uniref:WYL domain-containing protein n=1 Tax=Clostridium sp. NkU-1 TaxID=1095009 RepID=UPI003260AA54